MNSSRKSRRKSALYATGAVVVVAVLLYLAAFAHRSNSSSTNQPGTVNPSPQQAQQQAQSAAQDAGNTTQKTSNVGGSIQGNSSGAPASSTGNGSGPATPSGQIVSAHNVPSNATIDSVCNTTPGATCVIAFKNGSLVKSLPAETANSGGSTSWSWTAGSLLSSGIWTVTATATLNGKSASFTDSTDLTVQ